MVVSRADGCLENRRYTPEISESLVDRALGDIE